MALGAGYKARTGIGLESLAGDWGTLVAPTILLPFTTENLNPEREWQQNNALTNVLGQESPHLVGKKTTGSLQVYASYRNSEFLLMAAFGGTVGKTGAASPYTHTFDLGETWTRAFSTIIEKDVNCWNITGAMINTLTLNSSATGVFWDLDIIAKETTLTTTHRAALAALTYSESDPRLFHQDDLQFRIGDTADALAADDEIGVSDLNLSLNNKLVVDEKTSESGLYISIPVPNGKPELSLSFTIPRLEAQTLIDAQMAGTKMQADIIFTGAAVGVGNYTMTINLPTLYILTAPTNIGGEELINVPATCQCVRNDGNANMTETNPMELILQNGNDTALEWTA